MSVHKKMVLLLGVLILLNVAIFGVKKATAAGWQEHRHHQRTFICFFGRNHQPGGCVPR